MEMRSFKPFGSVSALTLGGGGLGQVWGETTREEAVATARLALECGITHFDMAPMYGRGEAEKVIGKPSKAWIPRSLILIPARSRRRRHHLRQAKCITDAIPRNHGYRARRPFSCTRN